ncbi:hypothetical protein [Rhizobium sp. SGZ-381]|uniref:hypothetical protein n=1 Tax=Rhizobium sp. SGZ-381 TaxID=3342800 RepID=UPI00366CC12C
MRIGLAPFLELLDHRAAGFSDRQRLALLARRRHERECRPGKHGKRRNNRASARPKGDFHPVKH